MKKIEFSKEQVNQIISLYKDERKTMTAIGKQFGVSKTVISRILKENNIENNSKNKYKGNYRIFQNIDTPEKAYWLGFIAADGCIYCRPSGNGGNFISINIHRKDKEHLKKFLQFLDSDSQIKDHIQNDGFSNNTPMSKVVINSNDMVKDCISHGIVPRKSLILEPPQIDKQFYLPFILGYFDGDGSVFQTKDGEFHINIVGTKEILEWINGLLNISSHLEKRKQDDKNNYYIRCGGYQKPYEILKRLYDSVSVHLDRKFEIFQTLQTVVLNRNIK